MLCSCQQIVQDHWGTDLHYNCYHLLLGSEGSNYEHAVNFLKRQMRRLKAVPFPPLRRTVEVLQTLG